MNELDDDWQREKVKGERYEREKYIRWRMKKMDNVKHIKKEDKQCEKETLLKVNNKRQQN